jgi:AraC family transcriptional regulator
MSIKITLEDLAGLVKMSVPHLMRKFKVDFGNSPAAYIMNLRVQFAKRLLTSKKEIPLKVIASEAGFCDQSHMTRVFQKFFGKTPIEIRQEHTNLVSENSVSSIVF